MEPVIFFAISNCILIVAIVIVTHKFNELDRNCREYYLRYRAELDFNSKLRRENKSLKEQNLRLRMNNEQ